MINAIAEDLRSLVVPIDSVLVDPRNARKHPDENMSAIKRSLEKYGQRKPIVVNKGTHFIEAGNGLFTAAKALGWTEIAVVTVDDDASTATGYGLMDNKSALLADWDSVILKDLLLELDTGAFDMNLTGFSSNEIEQLMTETLVPGTGLTDDDEVPDAPEPICKKGDLWKLGEHRLLCGDATVITDVEKLMQGDKANLILTDPPYGIDIVKTKGGAATIGGSKPYGSVGGGGSSDAMYPSVGVHAQKKGRVGYDSLVKANECYPIIGDDKPFDPAFLLTLSEHQIMFGANYYASKLPDGKAWIAWDKDVSGNFSEVELAWTSFEGRLRLYRHMWSGLRREGDRKTELTKRVHPTQKPVGLFVQILKDFEGEIVLDCYGGSGTTLIACEKLSRKCRMMELSESYCDVIIKRWEDFTGKKAELVNA